MAPHHASVTRNVLQVDACASTRRSRLHARRDGPDGRGSCQFLVSAALGTSGPPLLPPVLFVRSLWMNEPPAMLKPVVLL